MKKYIIVIAFLLTGIIVNAQDNCSSIKYSISSEEQLISKLEGSENKYSEDVEKNCGQINNKIYREECNKAKNMLSKVRSDISNAKSRKRTLEGKLRDCKN